MRRRGLQFKLTSWNLIVGTAHVTLLVLLDLSAAFDTVDHNVLLSRLHSKFGISGTALEWFRSYLNGRSQRVMVQGNLSQSLNLDFGVPQGSCLGPLLFTIYASKLFDVIKVHLPTVHCYADDTQLYVSFSRNISTGQFEAVTAVQHCVISRNLLVLKKPCKYKLRSDCDGLLLNPLKFKTLTTLGDRSFTAAAPQLWNSLPYSIRSSPSVASFKKTLKTFLFQKAFL